MLSSDKNIDLLLQLFEALRKWVFTKAEYLKIDAADKGVRIIAALVFVMLFLFFLFGIVMLVDIAIAVAISEYTGLAWALVIVAVAHFITLLLTIVFRTKLVIDPLVRFLSAFLA